MKLTRLLLMLALVLSFAVAPEAFGAKKNGAGMLSHSKHKSVAASDCYDIYCGGSSPDASCCGSVGDCLDVCDGVCGVPSGTCIYVE
jgi:hypothetical protein